MSKNGNSMVTDFSIQDVVDGKVDYTIEDWFKAFETTLIKLAQEKFQDATDQEKEQFMCLCYLACSAFAFHNDPRELSEKTYPRFQTAILDLQEEFKPFGLLLEAVQKRHFKDDMQSGLSNVEAVAINKKRLRKAFERSYFPKAFKKAQMDIQWD